MACRLAGHLGAFIYAILMCLPGREAHSYYGKDRSAASDDGKSTRILGLK